MKDMVIVKPTDKKYSSTYGAINSCKRAENYDYNALAEAYNQAEVGSIILLTLPRSVKTSNFTKILVGRGLKSTGTVGNGESPDFYVKRLIKDVNGDTIPVNKRPLALTKNSRSEMRKIA